MSTARFAIAFAPFIALLALGFGALQMYTSFLAFQRGNWQFGLFYLLFGIGGVALAMALWSARKKFEKLRNDEEAGGDGGDGGAGGGGAGGESRGS